MPNLRFIYDSSMAEGVRMSSLVDKAVASDKHLDDGTESDTLDDSNKENS